MVNFRCKWFHSRCKWFILGVNGLISGVNGLEGDGDIYRPDNLKVFQQFVLENTEGAGVHFVMADGVSFTSFMFVCLLHL